ncbi:MAG TPA: hypothetical protein VFM71_00595 [Gemmatimonadaceae bacterium]|nr:hypothetical protein [Gemmatimonadaceae bacterium]
MPTSTCTALVFAGHPLLRPRPSDFPRWSEMDVQRLAIAYLDGAYIALHKVFNQRLDYEAMRAILDLGEPSYPEVRDFLMYDNGVDPIIAARVAFRLRRHAVKGWN